MLGSKAHEAFLQHCVSLDRTGKMYGKAEDISKPIFQGFLSICAICMETFEIRSQLYKRRGKKWYVELVFLKWIITGPRQTGGLPVRRDTSNRWRYVTGVKSKSPREKVGSTVKMQSSPGTVQNHTMSCSCIFWARMMAGSGTTLMPRTNLFSSCTARNISEHSLSCGLHLTP